MDICFISWAHADFSAIYDPFIAHVNVKAFSSSRGEPMKGKMSQMDYVFTSNLSLLDLSDLTDAE